MTDFIGVAWPWLLLGISIFLVCVSANMNKLDLENYALLGMVMGLALGYVFGKILGHSYIFICSGILIGLAFGLNIRKNE